MYYLNLYLVQNDSPGITIGMEQITVPDKSKHSHYSWAGGLYVEKTVCELLIEEMGQEHAEQIERELNRRINEHFQIDPSIKDAITYYTFPSTPAFQLPFLFALDTNIHNKNYDGIFVSTGPLLNRDDIPDVHSFRKTIDAQEKISGQSFEYFKKLIERIIKSKLPESEKEACSYLTYYRFSRAYDVSLGECLLAKNRFLISNWDKLPWYSRPRSLSLSLNQILNHAQNILPKEEYNQLIDDISKDAKKALVLPCLDQKAADGGYYHLRYTEFKFIMNMDLALVDGQLVINLATNPGYQEYYAPGKKNHNIFESEMRALAKYNGWELEGNNFHQHMAFSAAYSQKLLETGIIKPTLIPEKQGGFFSTLTSMLFFTPKTTDPEAEEELIDYLIL